MISLLVLDGGNWRGADPNQGSPHPASDAVRDPACASVAGQGRACQSRDHRARGDVTPPVESDDAGPPAHGHGHPQHRSVPKRRVESQHAVSAKVNGRGSLVPIDSHHAVNDQPRFDSNDGDRAKSHPIVRFDEYEITFAQRWIHAASRDRDLVDGRYVVGRMGFCVGGTQVRSRLIRRGSCMRPGSREKRG